MLKKQIAILLVIFIIFTSTFTLTAAQSSSGWEKSLSALKAMGIAEASEIKANEKMTREIFAKIIINSTGNDETATALAGSSIYADVSKKSIYCGYINAAVKLGYLSAYSDGNFKPGSGITFIQFCTSTVKALGYGDSDIIGTWPAGYIEKAGSLGITAGFNYSGNAEVSAADAVVMIERMLNSNIKKVNSNDTDKTLVESAGLMDDQNQWKYSSPEVVFNFKPDTRKLGKIKFDPEIPILRDTTNNTVSPAAKVVGETISLNDIEDKDVVYEVYNKLGVLTHYLVVDNKVDGQITSILPSKYSPRQIEINNVKYDMGEHANANKFNSSSGSFNVEDNITAVLGYDGKLVDAYYAQDSTMEDYAFVVNASTMVSKEAADYGKVYYSVELMHVDGTRKTYKISEDPAGYNWRLVKYSLINDDTVALMNLGYITPNVINIDRYEKKVGQSDITDNVKIFNYTDSTVSLIKWSDIPNGQLPAGKIQYIGTTGDFGDANIILTNDVLNQQAKNFVVQSMQIPDGKRITTYSYSLVSGIDQYTYTSKEEIPGAVVGSVFNMKMYNNKVSSFNKIQDPDGLGWYVQAIDSKRMKMNEWIYKFNPNVSFYLKGYSGNLTSVKLTDITVGTAASYGSIRIYCDRPLNNGGKVQMVVFSMK